ncbi:uncharacterized protein PpBr36_10303 [Pyricularia pennisetigena]|uniref:uncharacterized protein n=1 Tax=Pyricularia pennisetigena TaxID=1578925 RepID=UPI001151F3D6|nr:uncharacterized protein PpBr36_10303 [Pyricularia pennisetigena]TLS21298.1 hypothetical protein PpBr36_10303 [Pyricularia pennisetigena]
MKCIPAVALLAVVASAERPWLNEPDTGLETFLAGSNWTTGTQPPLRDMRALPDFDFAARNTLPAAHYSFYRVAAAGEWSYRNNLEVWGRVRFRPRQLSDVTRVNETMRTSILGHEFSAPFFVAPAARGAYCDPERAELNVVEAAAAEDILYIPSMYASKSIEDIAAAKAGDGTLNGPQVTFQQVYTNRNLSVTWDVISRAERAGSKAIVWTVDAPGDSTRHRAARYDTTNANSVTSALTWELLDEMRARTKLPVILKGITTVEDALTAVEKGVDGIYLSNHGGRQLEYSPSPLEIAYEIRRNAPQVFDQVEVLADSGVRYGSDVLKLLALGVKAVGLGRPFMYANCYKVPGVAKAMQILKSEIVHDAAQAGVADLKKISPKLINTRALEDTVFLLD